MTTPRTWIDDLSEPLPSARTPSTPSTTTSTPAITQRRNPWANLGRTFQPTSDATEAFERSGLNWTVEKVGLRTDDLTPIPDRFAIRRGDNASVLGIVGTDYHPLQNADAFAFFHDLAGEGRITFETAGCFDRGGIVWVQARLPDLQIHLGDDVSETMLFISNGHVGNKPLTIAPTTYRIICRNSLRMAEAQHAETRRRKPGLEVGWTVRHTSGMAEALTDIREAYARTRRSHATTVQVFQHLASRPFTSRMKDTFFDQVFVATGPDESGRAKTIAENRRERLETILASSTSQVKGTAGSAFALLNAATEFIEHERTTRTTDGGNPDEARLISATFGSGAALKEKAWSTILDLVRA